MLVLTRDLARRFRAVLRRALPDGLSRGPGPTVLCRCDRTDLILQACQGDLAIRLHADRVADSAGAIALPADVLARCEGRTDAPVTLDEPSPGSGRARWDDGGVPQVIDFATVALDTVLPFPAEPKRLAPMPDHFRAALAEAVRTAAPQATRYALDRLQLHGTTGELIASDSKQLLIQRGFDFPWSEGLIVPRVPALLGADLLTGGPIGIARTASHVVFRGGPWVLALPIDTAGRFPRLDGIIPRATASTSRLRLDAQDVAALLTALPKLPGGGDEQSPITLDLGPPATVRARAAEGGPVAEVVLERSAVIGPPVRVVVNRTHLVRALGLGFTEVQMARPDKAVVCRDEQRIYVWMPLDATAAVPPSTDTVRVTTTDVKQLPAPRPTRRSPLPNPVAQRPGPAVNGQPSVPERVGVADVLAEAAVVRGLLRDAGARLGGLVTALKQQRRQSRAVQQAVQSLRQLHLDR